MTSLAEFTPYYLRSIWREGDTSLIEDLPRLVKEAEARISRDLRDGSIITQQDLLIDAPDDSIVLPADFRELVKLSFASPRPARAVPPDVLDSIRGQSDRYRDASTIYYSIYGGSLHVARWSDDIIGAKLAYYMGIKPFSLVDGVPSFYDRHPDFFLAALNAQTYSYMRDFDLSNEYNSKYVALLEDMRRESNYTMYPSGQLPSVMPDSSTGYRNSHVTSGWYGGSPPSAPATDYVSIYEAAKQ